MVFATQDRVFATQDRVFATQDRELSAECSSLPVVRRTRPRARGLLGGATSYRCVSRTRPISPVPWEPR